MCHQTSDVICDAQPTPDAGAKETGSLNHRWWDLERRELLCLWQFLTELNFQLLYDLAVALLGVYPREVETYVYVNLYTSVCSSFTHSSSKLESS